MLRNTQLTVYIFQQTINTFAIGKLRGQALPTALSYCLLSTHGNIYGYGVAYIGGILVFILFHS